jgi:hypothetical protein
MNSDFDNAIDLRRKVPVEKKATPAEHGHRWNLNQMPPAEGSASSYEVTAFG